jgi:hypothetical protein
VGDSSVFLVSPGAISTGEAVLEFIISTGVTSDENHSRSFITLPECMTITDISTNADDLGYTYFLAVSADSHTAIIFAPPLFGGLQPGESASFLVTVDVDGTCPGLICYDWDFEGTDFTRIEGKGCAGTVATDRAAWGSVKTQYR